MREALKRIVDRLPFGVYVRRWTNRWRRSKELFTWERRGRPNPPPHAVKQGVLREFAQAYGLKVFVETGTYYGDMIAAMEPEFARLYSMELSADLHAKSVRRFKGCTKIELIQGDSGVELANLLPRITEPALFWLDGHYSSGETAKGPKDTPILEELRHILSAENKRHVIVIDDARLFGTDPAYPTIAELTAFVKSLRPEVAIAVERDAIRITPSQGTAQNIGHQCSVP